MTSQIENIISAESSIQFDDILSPGKLCLVDLGSPPAGLTALSQFWSNLIVSLAGNHLLTRKSPWLGHRCKIYCDEAQLLIPVLSDLVENILCTGRSRGISLCLITQVISALVENSESKSLLGVLMGNCPYKIIGRLGPQDAEALCKTIAPSEGIDETIMEIRSKFITRSVNFDDREFLLLGPGNRERFRSVDVDLECWKQAEQNHAEAIDAMKHRLVIENVKPRLTLDEISPAPSKKTRQRKGGNVYPYPSRRTGQGNPWG